MVQMRGKERGMKPIPRPRGLKGARPDLVVRDGGYVYTTIAFFRHGSDLIIRLTGSPPARWYMIVGYRRHTALDIIRSCDLGRHFVDGILRIWKTEGLPLGWVQRCTRSLDRPAGAYTAEVDVEEQGQLAFRF